MGPDPAPGRRVAIASKTASSIIWNMFSERIIFKLKTRFFQNFKQLDHFEHFTLFFIYAKCFKFWKGFIQVFQHPGFDPVLNGQMGGDRPGDKGYK